MLLIQKKLVELLHTKKYYSNYYNRSITKYRDINAYITLFDRLSKKSCPITTDKKINHTACINFGCTLNSVKRDLHASFSIVKAQKFCNILFYKMKIGTYKIVVELHFFKNKLVFFKYLFPSLRNQREIEKQLRNKYLEKNRLIDFDSQYIIDPYNNYIKIDNEVCFSIYYISPNFGFFEYLSQRRKILKKDIKLKKQLTYTELIDKL
ncbi:conserved protein of unknown function [Tenacibaculum sp. 190524A02b]